MNKLFLGFFISVLFLSIPQLSLAETNLRKELRSEVKEAVQEKKETVINKLKTAVKRLTFEVHKEGSLTGISGNTLTLTTSDNKSYTVNVTAKTQLRRRFWGKSELSEFSIGDKLNIIGRWTDEAKTTIEAKMIRNNSIQKRWGVFFGDIIQINSDNFIMQTVSRDTQTVYFGNAKFINRKEQSINFSDLQIGHKVRAKGMWDRTLKKITEVTEVKDFSI